MRSLGKSLTSGGHKSFKSAGGALWGGGTGWAGLGSKNKQTEKTCEGSNGGRGVISGKHEDKTDGGAGGVKTLALCR